MGGVALPRRRIWLLDSHNPTGPGQGQYFLQEFRIAADRGKDEAHVGAIKRGAWQDGVIGVLVKDLHVVQVVFLDKRPRRRELGSIGIDPDDMPLRPHAATQRPENPHGATP